MMTTTTSIPPGALSPAQRSVLERRSRFAAAELSQLALPRLPDVPGMINETEARYLYWLTSQAYAGMGAVVEVGTWLGRSTLHLAAGLREAGFQDALHCFDQFVWLRSHALKSSLPLRKGDDFQPDFERNVRAFYPSIRVTKTKMDDLVWNGGPIEILFLDAPKTLRDLSSVIAAFGPSLIPGVSIIVLQDYQHLPSFPVAAVLSCLENNISFLHALESGGSVTFTVEKELRFDAAQPIHWNYNRWTCEDATATWRRILAPLPARSRARMAGGLALLLHDNHGKRAAFTALGEVEINDELRATWRRFAVFPFYEHYRPLFRLLGIRPQPGERRRLARLRWKVRELRASRIRPLRRRIVNWLRSRGLR